ncbi:hypothetical protein [Roseinatronobacter sp. NSM]|uniref:hypothetical protein n=1 Tax=Roseinatronobacter sp. NSM TaxID=3457785 RepID=UPI0040352411
MQTDMETAVKGMWVMIWEALVHLCTAAALWLSGEAGRVAVAGGAGAIIRWWASEKKNLRNGVVQTLSGGLVATYMWPLVFGMLNFFIPALGKDPETIAASAFVAGMMGISIAKIALALVESYARQHQPPQDGGRNG